MYQNIVVGFDDSDYSRSAAVEAAAWAKKHGGKVTLLHAVYFDTEEFGIAPEQLDKRLKAGREAAKKATDMVRATTGVECETVIREGEAHDVLLDHARTSGADLIAMGTHGRRGISRLIMGSVTASVIADSPCDVLVVKKPCDKCTGTYGSLIVPFDGSQASGKALVRAVELAKADGSVVTALYSVPRYEEMVDFYRTESIQKSLMAEAAKITAGAERIGAENGGHIATVVGEGPAHEQIIHMAKKLGADLIVMGSHGWRGFNKALLGSTCERVIATSASPVLVVR